MSWDVGADGKTVLLDGFEVAVASNTQIASSIAGGLNLLEAAEDGLEWWTEVGVWLTTVNARNRSVEPAAEGAPDAIPPRPPDGPYSEDEWRDLIVITDRVSARVLTTLQEQIEHGAHMNPQVAGIALLTAMGRLAGRYGYRHLGSLATWKAWTDDRCEPLFSRGFRSERSKED